jgi:hypothetical protein
MQGFSEVPVRNLVQKSASNNGVQPTGNSVRSSLAPAIPSG